MTGKGLPKGDNYPSLWQREVRRDFIKQCRYYYGPINNLERFIGARS